MRPRFLIISCPFSPSYIRYAAANQNGYHTQQDLMKANPLAETFKGQSVPFALVETLIASRVYRSLTSYASSPNKQFGINSVL